MSGAVLQKIAGGLEDEGVRIGQWLAIMRLHDAKQNLLRHILGFSIETGAATEENDKGQTKACRQRIAKVFAGLRGGGLA